MEQPASGGEPVYEPPQVEVVVTGDVLERESLYAGAVYGDSL